MVFVVHTHSGFCLSIRGQVYHLCLNISHSWLVATRLEFVGTRDLPLATQAEAKPTTRGSNNTLY